LAQDEKSWVRIADDHATEGSCSKLGCASGPAFPILNFFSSFECLAHRRFRRNFHTSAILQIYLLSPKIAEI
jgi:hypothetical protein